MPNFRISVLVFLMISLCHSSIASAGGRGNCHDRGRCNVVCNGTINNNGNGHGHGYGRCDISEIEVFLIKGLNFPVSLGRVNHRVYVSPDDYGSALFSVRGEPNKEVVVRVVDQSTQMFNEVGDVVGVIDFTIGGSVGSDGVAVIDNHGELEDIRVGATGVVSSSSGGGHYISPSIELNITYVD